MIRCFYHKAETVSFFQSPGIALLFIVISSNLARYRIMPSPPNFKISPGMPSGPTDFFFLIVDVHFLTMLISVVKGLPDCVGGISGFLLSQLIRDT
jgi:hypothetical protein